jgi:hypothetical protein
MLCPRSLVLRTHNLFRFFVVLPLLFERLEELIRTVRAGGTLPFASSRTFSLVRIISLNHGICIVLARRRVDVRIPRADRINGERRSDVRTTSHNRVHFIVGSLGQWDLTLAQQQLSSLPL